MIWRKTLDKELWKKISKISCFMLLFFILVARDGDKLINGTINVFLLGILGLVMTTLPFVEFVVAIKYQ